MNTRNQNQSPAAAKMPPAPKSPRFSLFIRQESGVLYENTPFNRALIDYYTKLDEKYMTLLKQAGGRGLQDERLNEQVRLTYAAALAVQAIFEMLPWAASEGDEPDEMQAGLFEAESALSHLGDLAFLLKKRDAQ